MEIFRYLAVTSFALLMSITLFAQDDESKSNIDELLIQGEYSKVVTICLELIKADSLNPEVYHKLGIAYQNLMQTDKSIDAFKFAIKLNPDIKKYHFTLAKYYFNLGKVKQALPIFANLCKQDSTNWIYAYYLADIFMQKGLYNHAAPVYSYFYQSDTTNSTYIDKYAFCHLRMENYDTAIILYEKSIKQNSRNISALKNLSYLYLKMGNIDTAIYQLAKGIEIDSMDYDLYNRRADIYFSQNLHFKAGMDYHKVLSSGDSTKIVLKRLGIGLLYNQQNIEALDYLKAAFKKDSGDFEISSYLGQAYYNLKQYRKSIKYYNKVLETLAIFAKQIDYTHVLIADSYKDSSLYNQAISHYSKAFNNKYTSRICMTIAHIYDNNLNNSEKAIYYYQQFLNNLDKKEFVIGPEYVENVKKRLDWLIENKNKKKGIGLKR